MLQLGSCCYSPALGRWDCQVHFRAPWHGPDVTGEAFWPHRMAALKQSKNGAWLWKWDLMACTGGFFYVLPNQP